ncbi:hypothetical protein HNQ51_003791 [Inhella inkyongensis]|uniref:Uncharacterized protein n=1 Tax=Inhella inkyongensis TaxID=392593 RepID=A0A840S7J1_9BURK|nr:hypothetical protein [Inhella inkyongensis]MBB5206445.1 hypothetical protein [Inhella inkyongensis]
MEVLPIFQMSILSNEQESALRRLLVNNVSAEHFPSPANPFRAERKCLVDAEGGVIICVLQGLGMDLLPTKYFLAKDDCFALVEVPWKVNPEVRILFASGEYFSEPTLTIGILNRGLQMGGRYLVGYNSAMSEFCNISNAH